MSLLWDPPTTPYLSSEPVRPAQCRPTIRQRWKNGFCGDVHGPFDLDPCEDMWRCGLSVWGLGFRLRHVPCLPSVFSSYLLPACSLPFPFDLRCPSERRHSFCPCNRRSLSPVLLHTRLNCSHGLLSGKEGDVGSGRRNTKSVFAPHLLEVTPYPNNHDGTAG